MESEMSWVPIMSAGRQFGIHKVIAWGLEPETKEGEEYTPIYPCPIVNRFECPYEKDVNKLFAIEEIAFAIHGFS